MHTKHDIFRCLYENCTQLVAKKYKNRATHNYLYKRTEVVPNINPIKKSHIRPLGSYMNSCKEDRKDRRLQQVDI